MANKIVQLQDKTNTDNLFPIAGGMAADSITTAMIQDGAVTTDKLADSSISTTKVADKAVTLSKIDFTTIAPVYAQHTWTRTNTTSSQGAAAINGAYTTDKTLAEVTLTPVKSGLMDIEFNIPCNTASGGTPFIIVRIDGARTISGAVPPVGEQQGQSPIVMKGIVQVTPNVQHTFTLQFSNGNAISSHIPSLLPAYFSVMEIG